LIKSFGRQAYEVDRFGQEAAEVRDLSIKQYTVARWLNALLGFLSALGPALLLLIGGALFIRGQVSLGTIVAFGGLLSRLYAPAGTLANSHVQIMGALALFDRLFEYLDLPAEIQERPDAVDLKEVRGDVQFRNVSFRYGSGPWILKGISFEARPGKLVALVGPSGAGKTTATYLIPRFYDATDGVVEVDGHDVRDLSFQTLQRAIGIVSQEPALFHGTIRENLRYANLAASDQMIDEACRAAYIYEVIERLPKQYDTLVGERGFHLSGGEKQRLAIARVLLRDPAILILDEATSHLDYESEAKVQAALEKVCAGRTVLVIAHRLSTVLRADKILVVDDGRIVEEGRHEDLLTLGGLYARLYREQFKS
jgi:ATP-binding cassette subfamily B protein